MSRFMGVPSKGQTNHIKTVWYSKLHMQNGQKVDICLDIYYLLRSLRLGLSRFMRVPKIPLTTPGTF